MPRTSDAVKHALAAGSRRLILWASLPQAVKDAAPAERSLMSA